MMYVMSKKPEIVEQLAELYQPNFLEEENLEEAETVRDLTAATEPTKKAPKQKKTVEAVIAPEEKEDDKSVAETASESAVDDADKSQNDWAVDDEDDDTPTGDVKEDKTKEWEWYI